MSKKTFILIIFLAIAAVGGLYYWFFVRDLSPGLSTTSSSSTKKSAIFGSQTSPGNTNGAGGTSSATSTASTTITPIAVLRELSKTPVGGMVASTTASSTIIRWIDRGVGRVYQAYSNSNTIDELSNTTIPRVYRTIWDKNADAFILQSLTDDSDAITTIYAGLFPNISSSTTPFELRGSPLPASTVAVVASPEGNKVLTLETTASNSSTVGYISQFDGSKKTLAFSTPLTQVNVEWPTDSTIALTTKGSSNAAGFLYFIDPKTGLFNKILGNIRGLSTLTSKDANKVLFSTTLADGIKTSVYDIPSATTQDLIFNTLPEKCVWSSLQKTVIYCAVPSQIPSATYPDAWYQGTVSFSDSIWEVDAVTGSAHIVADLLKSSGTVIDAMNLTLDPKENYLYFINKRDLSLWSLQLNN